MFANSWLYHYYSVQSKIQFGIPYEGPTRAPPANATYFHHHHSPTIQSGLSHSYVAPMSYHGYHSPVGIPPHQSSPGIMGHNGNGPSMNHHHNSNDHYRPYAYRIDAVTAAVTVTGQPVDYSQLTPLNNQIEPRCSSANSLSNGSNQIGSPPSKRRAIARLEPLYIPENQESSDTSIPDVVSYTASSHVNDSVGMGGGNTLVIHSIAPPHQRVHSKAIQMEPPDFMDQWNPSPPWSETTQKVPDIVQQELSPYLARTPPTPTSAPPSHTNGNGPAFSFDWMPEQFVPIMDYAHGIPCHDGIVSVPPPPLHSSILPPVPIQMHLQMADWQSDHKLMAMHSDKRPDEEMLEQRRSH